MSESLSFAAFIMLVFAFSTRLNTSNATFSHLIDDFSKVADLPRELVTAMAVDKWVPEALQSEIILACSIMFCSNVLKSNCPVDNRSVKFCETEGQWVSMNSLCPLPAPTPTKYLCVRESNEIQK